MLQNAEKTPAACARERGAQRHGRGGRAQRRARRRTESSARRPVQPQQRTQKQTHLETLLDAGVPVLDVRAELLLVAGALAEEDEVEAQVVGVLNLLAEELLLAVPREGVALGAEALLDAALARGDVVAELGGVGAAELVQHGVHLRRGGQVWVRVKQWGVVLHVCRFGLRRHGLDASRPQHGTDNSKVRELAAGHIKLLPASCCEAVHEAAN